MMWFKFLETFSFFSSSSFIRRPSVEFHSLKKKNKEFQPNHFNFDEEGKHRSALSKTSSVHNMNYWSNRPSIDSRMEKHTQKHMWTHKTLKNDNKHHRDEKNRGKISAHTKYCLEKVLHALKLHPICHIAILYSNLLYNQF